MLPVLLAFLVLAASSVLAQAPAGPAGVPSGSGGEASEKLPAGRGPTDGREVEAFMDGYFARQLESSEIPGATVSVVKDGEVLFAKGYGEADVEAGEPVVADETLFRVGSVSKLFTATAAMQLVEEGRLDLDRDANRYLGDVEIPDTYPGRPVTLRHLLTHTAGFEQGFTGTVVRGAADLEPLGEFVSGSVPARVKPPGEITSYSNYGMALIGRIVEEASGTSFERYVEENVTRPLGMTDTTTAQPPAPGLRERLATGYDVRAGGEPTAAPFEYIQEAPAGSISSTATDVARFMSAHLQNGRLGDARILEEATAREMHATQFSNAPRLDGMGFGFTEQTVNGERVIGHGGNTTLFHSLLTLLPERNVGIFVSYNSYGTGPGRMGEYDLQKAFMDRYYPGTPPPDPEPFAEGASGDAERVAGSYRSTRGDSTGYEKVLGLVAPTSVTANEDGSITTSSGVTTQDFSPQDRRWVEVGPMVFRAERGGRLAFRQDGEGRVTYMATDADPTSAFEKVSAYESATLHLGLLVGGLAVFGLTALAWPAGAVISWRYGRRHRRLYGEAGGGPPRDAGGARPARLLAWVLCVVALLLVGAAFLAITNPLEILFYGDSPVLAAIRALPYLVAVLAVGVAVCAALSWGRGYWGLFGRLHYSLIAVAAVPFVALLGYYNLLAL